MMKIERMLAESSSILGQKAYRPERPTYTTTAINPEEKRKETRDKREEHTPSEEFAEQQEPGSDGSPAKHGATEKPGIDIVA